jgi:hypothetical protein
MSPDPNQYLLKTFLERAKEAEDRFSMETPDASMQ